MPSLRGLVSGHVQGVGFRYFVRSQAQLHGLSGYAHNLRDGRVEFLLQGELSAIEKVVAQIRIGPRYARVDDVRLEEGGEQSIVEGFTTC